jgi:uncharacterized integral membrane protein
MPAFVKTPRFIISTIFLIWLISTILSYHNQPPIEIFYAPYLSVQVRVVWALLAAAVLGSVVTIAVQLMWSHRASKNASSSVAA